ncbi:hypothetical protein N7478_012433 [Penicillium angulare]|uniref:uncharacterized protein n=1 Tax=Penicillium angulare TaxID=116970 RepID=UPI0025408004|nr:uncharacterized protein N7478_012433 [Penicillium angulare]KAJ5259452.1 hypothetical protein N7478_012433 [Penicillium angulare]
MASEPLDVSSQIPQKASGPKKSSLMIDHGSNGNQGGAEAASNGLAFPRIVSPNGDLIIEHTDPSSTAANMSWQVSSKMLIEKSPYFRAMLDPVKFAEGRQLAQQIEALNINLNSHSEFNAETTEDSDQISLPVVYITANTVTKLCGPDVLGLFIKVLCLDCMDDHVKQSFQNALKIESPSTIAKLIHIADAFNSLDQIKAILRSIDYQYGKKGRASVSRFSTVLLKMKEDRIRQIILISKTIQNPIVTRVFTHVLVIAGSRFWRNAPEPPSGEYLQWHYLPSNVEEELYYRRQCVMNTITDLHAYFLRAYGALEDTDPNPAPPRSSLGAAFSTSSQTRHFQCRAGLANASQCDMFQLGQMVRFFTMRSKTAFVGSNLTDPDFSLDPSSEDGDIEIQDHSPASSDVITTITSLRQYPDYQIDAHHGSCGVRRRLLPIIPCIEKYLLDSQGLLGIDYVIWSNIDARHSAQWIGSRKTHSVDVRQAQIVSISAHRGEPKSRRWVDRYAEALFTAKSRNWEA